MCLLIVQVDRLKTFDQNKGEKSETHDNNNKKVHILVNSFFRFFAFVFDNSFSSLSYAPISTNIFVCAYLLDLISRFDLRVCALCIGCWVVIRNVRT